MESRFSWRNHVFWCLVLCYNRAFEPNLTLVWIQGNVLMCRLKKSVYRDHVFEAIAEFLCEKGASRRLPLRGHALIQVMEWYIWDNKCTLKRWLMMPFVVLKDEFYNSFFRFLLNNNVFSLAKWTLTLTFDVLIALFLKRVIFLFFSVIFLLLLIRKKICIYL